jgi:hypothetical protein
MACPPVICALGANVAPIVAAEAVRRAAVSAFLCMLDTMPIPSLSGPE